MAQNNNQDWDRWRGSIDTQMETHAENIDTHARRLDTLDSKVGDILFKLAVPLFLVGIAGPVVGALIVWAITKR